ncbi:MAG: ATP-dependent zinc protease [Spirulinaceae cyanobacterium SM2_1_0]|nr:ATP-dependent zinc protease [Spirulinaceae cyanobacterium SM2_1_0]
MSDQPPACSLPLIGWREWVALPELGLPCLKAKIDTGARSSALHAFGIEMLEKNGGAITHFCVHPRQRRTDETVSATAPLLDWRDVRSSSGSSQRRPTIRTVVQLGDWQWPIELTLANRELMGFRLLLGREAVRQRFWIDAGRSYLQGDRPRLDSTL